jgi:hypothetical protein
MKYSNEISAELKEVSPFLADLPEVANPYLVPVGYFESLPSAIIDGIRFEALLPNKLSPTYSVPKMYFEGLAQEILSKIAIESEDELAEMTPVLHSINKQPVYSIPDGYFGQPVVIPVEENIEKQKGKLVTLKGYRRFIQYAAAAMVAGILVSGAFLYTDSRSYIEEEKKDRLDITVPATGMDGALLKDSGANKEAIESEEAETTLDTDKVSPDNKTDGFTKKIQLLSEEELKKYLEENAIPEPMQSEPIEFIEDTTEK